MAYQSVDAPTGGNQQETATRTFYSRTLLETLYPLLVIARFGRNSESIPRKEGQTINWRHFARFAPADTPLVEGEAPTPSNLVIAEVEATVAQYGDYVEWSDKFVETGPDPYVTQTLTMQGPQAGETFDTVTWAAIKLAMNVTTPTGGAVNTLEVTDLPTTAMFDTAIANLRNRHVPYVTQFLDPQLQTTTVPGLPAFMAPVTPDQWKIIKNLDGVDKVDTYRAGNTTFENEVGKYDAIRFIETTTGLTGADGNVSALVQYQPILGQDAFGIVQIAGAQQGRAVVGGSVLPVVRPVGVADSGDPLGQLGSVGWKGYFAAKILDQDKLEMCAYGAG